MPFVSGDSQSSLAIQPSNLHTMKHGHQDVYQHELNSQLQHEREQHTVTKHLLQCEQEKVLKLQTELQDSKRLASKIVEGNRLNAEVLHAAINRIGSRVDRKRMKLALLDLDRDVPSSDAVNADVGLQDFRDHSAHDLKTSSVLQNGSTQLPAPGLTDHRPSILYDVLAQQKVGDLDRVPDFHSSFREDADFESVDQDFIRQSDEARRGEQNLLDTQVQQPPRHCVEDVDNFGNLDQLEIRASADLSEFRSLDEAFESDFFSKPAKGSETGCRAPGKARSDEALIDILSEKHRSPKSEDVSSPSSQIGISEPTQPPSSEQGQDNTAPGAAVVRRTSTVGRPVSDDQPVS
jgi:hypothetical protein